MNKINSNKFGLKKWLILPFIALVTFLLTKVFLYNPEIAETYYAQSIYPIFAGIVSQINSIFPFSLDDLFYIYLIFTTIFLLFLLLLRKISFKKAGKITLNTLALVYVVFYWGWGFNYFRNDLNTRLDISETGTNKEQFLEKINQLILNTNQSHTTFTEFSAKKADSEIEESYQKLAPFLALKYPMGKRKAKQITFSRFFASATISGYFGPFFNEVHVNRFILPVEYPMVLAHEKAHQFGITSEAEANFYAWLVCSQSPSKQLQYSANIYVLKFFLFQSYKLKNYKELIGKIDKTVIDDFRKIEKHWMELQNKKIDAAAGKINDAYLKTNHIEQGIDDYTGVVKLIMDFTYDSKAQEKIKNIIQN